MSSLMNSFISRFPFSRLSFIRLTFLRWTQFCFLLLVVTLVNTLSCTNNKVPTSPNQSEKKTVNLFIWSNYVSEQSIKEFEQESQIKVNLTHFASNEELLAKLQAGATGYDVIVPSDYMVAILIKLGLLEPLKQEFITNRSHLKTFFMGREFDPKNEFSVPYGWATTGLAYNKKFFPEGVHSWKDLFENPKLKGHVGILDDTREVYTMALKILGQSANTKDEKTLKLAQDYLLKNKAQIKAFLSDPMDALVNGEIWAAQIYSSDGLQAKSKTKGQIQYMLPDEGGTFSIDNLVIPRSAQNKEGAHKLINYLISLRNNQRFVQNIFAGPVLNETKETLPKELQEELGLFPTEESMKKMEPLNDLGPTTAIYDRMWTEFKTQ